MFSFFKPTTLFTPIATPSIFGTFNQTLTSVIAPVTQAVTAVTTAAVPVVSTSMSTPVVTTMAAPVATTTAETPHTHTATATNVITPTTPTLMAVTTAETMTSTTTPVSEPIFHTMTLPTTETTPHTHTATPVTTTAETTPHVHPTSTVGVIEVNEQPSEGLGAVLNPLFVVGNTAVAAVANIIPSPFNLPGGAISTAHDAIADVLISIPKVLTIGDIPVVSTIGEAATTLVQGATTMTEIVLDHAIMTAGEISNLVTTPATGILNMMQDLLSNPCGCTIDELLCNDTPEIDSIADIIKQINAYEYNSITHHLGHDILLLKTPVDTIHKALTESAEDLGIAPVINPALDLVRNTWDFGLEDVVGGLVVNPLLGVWKDISESLFGTMPTTGMPSHDYANNLSTAQPTVVDVALSNATRSWLDNVFNNTGETAGEGNAHTYHNTNNPTFADTLFNHIAVALPVMV